MSPSDRNARRNEKAIKDSGKAQAQAITRSTNQAIRAESNRERRRVDELKKSHEALDGFEAKDLASFSDVDLAKFQTSFPDGSPQRALAMNEWNRRLMTGQIRATRFSSVVGVAGIVIGVILGWILASYNFEALRKQYAQDLITKDAKQEASQQPSADHQREDPDKVSPQPDGEPKPNGQP